MVPSLTFSSYFFLFSLIIESGSQNCILSSLSCGWVLLASLWVPIDMPIFIPLAAKTFLEVLFQMFVTMPSCSSLVLSRSSDMSLIFFLTGTSESSTHPLKSSSASSWLICWGGWSKSLSSSTYMFFSLFSMTMLPTSLFHVFTLPASFPPWFYFHVCLGLRAGRFGLTTGSCHSSSFSSAAGSESDSNSISVFSVLDGGILLGSGFGTSGGASSLLLSDFSHFNLLFFLWDFDFSGTLTTEVS